MRTKDEKDPRGDQGILECIDCGISKETSKFDGNRRKCRSCRADLIRNRKRLWLNNKKVKSGCIRCGYNEHHVALCFHHTEEKDMRIKAFPSLSWNDIFRETSKCVILCQNCHMIVHYEDIKNARTN